MHAMAKMAKNRQRTGDSNWPDAKSGPYKFDNWRGPYNCEPNVCHFRHNVHCWTYLECSQKPMANFSPLYLQFLPHSPSYLFPTMLTKVCQACRFRCWCIFGHKCLWAQNLATLEQVFYLVCLFIFKLATLYKYRKKRKKIEIIMHD